MEIVVQRITYGENYTQGEMSLDGDLFGWTLEPQKDQSKGKPYCVPAGTYPLIIGDSEHFDMDVPKVLDIPGFTGVEIHPGNFPKDTHGCCLIGFTQTAGTVGNSRMAFAMLMDKLKGTTGNTITYRG